jgi:hypothetical protein
MSEQPKTLAEEDVFAPLGQFVLAARRMPGNDVEKAVIELLDWSGMQPVPPGNPAPLPPGSRRLNTIIERGIVYGTESIALYPRQTVQFGFGLFFATAIPVAAFSVVSRFSNYFILLVATRGGTKSQMESVRQRTSARGYFPVCSAGCVPST